jgi:creatinine amidohydrolase
MMNLKSIPDSSCKSWTGGLKNKITRRQLLKLLTAGGSAVVLSGCSFTFSPFQSSFEGYSVFHETMVEMPWPAIKQAAENGAIVLLPVGVIEEHGPHLGLASDIYQTYNWAKMARQVLEAKGIPTLIAPPVYWGISVQVRNYPGTFSVSDQTMKSLLYDIHSCLKDWGFKYVFSINAHGDTWHNHIFQQAIQEAHEKLGIGAYGIYSKGISQVPDYAVLYGPVTASENIQKHLDRHAGAFETAEMAAYFPEDVNESLAQTLKPSTEFAPLGYWGDPASYNLIKPEEIRKLAEDIAKATADAIEEFLREKS